LGKYSCGSSPLWLHHKIDPKTKSKKHWSVIFFCGKNSPFCYIKNSQATSLMELIGKNPKKSPNFEEEKL